MIKRNISIYWLLSLLYMGLIFYLSSYPVAIKVPSFPCSDKLAHIAAYGVLASLIYIALKKGNVNKHHVVALAFTILFLYTSQMRSISILFLGAREIFST